MVDIHVVMNPCKSLIPFFQNCRVKSDHEFLLIQYCSSSQGSYFPLDGVQSPYQKFLYTPTEIFFPQCAVLPFSSIPPTVTDAILHQSSTEPSLPPPRGAKVTMQTLLLCYAAWPVVCGMHQ